MASPTFGFPSTPSSGNNAPLPMFGQNTNPTGGGFGTGTGSSGFPNFPMFGPAGTTSGPMANMPVFSGTSGGLQHMSSGFDLGSNWRDLANRLGSSYGKGPGQAIYNLLSEGMFNPQVAAAFLNAMQPGIQRGEANLLSAFGSEGARFGTEASFGLGDYLSQVNLNEQQTLAQMFLTSQQDQLQLLESVMPTLAQARADQGNWFSNFMRTAADMINFPAGSPSPSGAGSFFHQQPGPPSGGTPNLPSTPTFGNTGGSSIGNLQSSGMSGLQFLGAESSGGAALGGAAGADAGAGSALGGLGGLSSSIPALFF